MKPSIAPLIIGGIFLLVGIMLIVKYVKRKIKCTASVSGEVVGYREELSHSSHSHSSHMVYYPIFTYYFNGEWHRKEGSLGRGNQKYDIGEHVELLCDPQNPEEFLIANDKASPIVAIVCALMGLVVVVLAFVG